MKTTKTKADESILVQLVQAYGDAAKAHNLLESRRWPNSPVCPHCKNTGEKRISKLEPHRASMRGLRPPFARTLTCFTACNT